MKITGVELLYGGAGWRNLSFLKISTDEGLVGWSEFPEANIGQTVSPLVNLLGQHVVGSDPRKVQSIVEGLRRRTWGASFGAVARAIGALENAIVDIKAKALNIAVHEMLGGAMRDRLPMYWSHCGTHHITHAEALGVEPVHSLDDFNTLGKQVKDAGYHALKTNIIIFGDGKPYPYRPGAFGGAGDADRNPARYAIKAAFDQLSAFRDGAGPDVGLMLDTNFNFRTEGYLRMARALEPLDLDWLEVDNFDASALAQVRRGTRTSIASCETLTGRRQLRPFLDEQAIDVAIIDVPWNGILESMRMAALCEAYEVNVACHNYSGPIATMISANFCAAVTNFRVMEMDVVQVPHTWDLVTQAPVVDAGSMLIPTGIGWGADVNEDAIKEYPPV